MDPMTMLASFNGEDIATIAVVGGISIAIIGMVLGTVRRTVQTKEREQTRREIAAYIAEGSMTPEQGERILTAKEGKSPRC